MLDHTALYHQIVKQEHYDALHSIVAEQLAAIEYELLDLTIVADESLPHILCRVNAAGTFAAVMLGLFVDIRPILPHYTDPHYYLPLVILRDETNERMQRLINQKLALQHELLHLQDMLRLIQERPDYPTQSYRYGLHSVTVREELPKSIDLELFKLFYIEPPAMRLDYRSGERHILIPFDANARIAVRYDCETMEEYVAMNMHSYITGLADNFKARFENDAKATELIDAEIERGLKRYGRGVFGTNPSKGFAEVEQASKPKILQAMLAGQFV